MAIFVDVNGEQIRLEDAVVILGSDGIPIPSTAFGGGGGGGLTNAQLRATPVPVSGTISSSPVGAPNYNNDQVTASTTAATLLAARATRRSVTFTNMDSAITVYIGKATVSLTNGHPLKPGQSISIDAVGLFQVIAESGAPIVAFIEVWD